ncbi:hypothetical protein Tco_1010718 [Tanacetum coccineum]
MEHDFSNMTLNEYLMYQGRHKNLEISCTSRKSVASMRNRILVYPDSDEEGEEYCSLPPLLPCFQTPQPYAIINFVHHNSHNEVDIDNITIEEYARYELTMSTMKSKIQVPTQGIKNIDIAEEKEEVLMKDVEMDENHDIDHSGTKEALQWSLAKDPFLVVMELNDQSSFLLHTISSFVSNEVKKEFTTPHMYKFLTSCALPVAYLHPYGKCGYYHPHLISSEGINTLDY